MESKILKAVKAFMDERKVENVNVIDVSKLTPFATHYVLVTAPNPRALGAMSEMLEDELAKQNFSVRAKDGNSESGWVIVDAGEVVIHFFIEEKRAEMGLDDLLEKANSNLIKKQA